MIDCLTTRVSRICCHAGNDMLQLCTFSPVQSVQSAIIFYHHSPQACNLLRQWLCMVLYANLLVLFVFCAYGSKPTHTRHHPPTAAALMVQLVT